MLKKDRPIVVWLLLGCILIFAMVVVGGMTRLTNSGLSMVEWNLFMGSVPPTSETDWQELFDKYKQYPEYKLVNFNISLDEFKSIFYWEYGHRMLGRLLGVIFLVPFLWFWIKGRISKDLMPKLLIILAMGAFQGFLGYWMVESGLVKDPDVSHYRLAAHLLTAFLTFAYTFWVALSLIYSKSMTARGGSIEQEDNWEEKSTSSSSSSNPSSTKPPIFKWIQLLLAVLIIQIIWGAYVAGLNAGKIYNTWPKMGEDWVAESVTAMSPWWHNFIEGMAGVQFVHRYLAYAVVGLVLFIYFKGRRMNLFVSQRRGLNALLIAVGLQFILGVFTLLYAVPISLGLLHQLGAFFLLGATVYVLHRFQLRA
ncbi:MAG: heme A synthase [Flavobacteriales bacterium]|nr:heme A synthase [Flavobacteriales bacterium]